MQRVRRAADIALALVVALCLSSVPAATSPFGGGVVRAATVPWPVSSLVVSEVQTGGSGASDEFVEIANQGAGPVDLIGLEVVYATSSGSTVTRKATWTASTILAAGRRTLVANSVGSYVGLADATYTGGFAATGGAIALRVVGGSVVDAVGWGDATNAFVEGTVAVAPPASSSLERRPGGAAGNGADSNDNGVDWFVSGVPGPQNLAAPAVPDAAPTPTPTPEPTPEPTAPPLAIADARTLADGMPATISGVLTTDLGALDASHGGFVQDDTAGIAIYLDAAIASPIPAGTVVIVHGTVDDRFAQRTLRVALGDITIGGSAPLAAPAGTGTGAASEALEGRRIRTSGPITVGPDVLADGTAITIDDGTGALRVIVLPPALGAADLAVGATVTVTGPLGQRDSSGTGTAGYRLFVASGADLVVEPPATPTPTTVPTPTPNDVPTPTPGPTPTPDPSPGPSPTPGTSPSPSPSPNGPTIADVRALPIGTVATVRGVVTAEAGRLGTPSLIAIADPTGGIVVKLPSGSAPPARGRVITVSGSLADPYGQLELRASPGGVVLGGTEALPPLIDLPPSGPAESTEGRLVRLTGTVLARPSKAASGDISVLVQVTGGSPVRVMADASSGLGTSSFSKGARYRIVGIAGQRATRKGALDGYRVWARDRGDVTLLAAAPSATPTPRGSGGPATPAPSVTSIARALRVTDRDVRIDAVVTAGATLLDASGRRIVVQDASGAIEILLPKDGKAPSVGTRIRVVGRVGTAYGAPRLRAESVDRRGTSPVPAPLRVQGPLTSAHTWRLVSVTGRVADVTKLGERWRAEIAVGAHRLVVLAQPGARIPNTTLLEGRIAEIVGIVRPAYPSASDKRASILPRSRSDVRVTGGTSAATTSGGGRTTGIGAPVGSLSAAASGAPAPLEIDLADLPTSIGRTVSVGGLVRDLRPDGFTIDDSTATARIVLAGEATELIGLIEPDDAISATGRVERLPDGEVGLAVADPSGIVLASVPRAPDPSSSPPASASPMASAAGDVRVAALADPTGLLPGAGFGLAGVVAVGLASVALTVLRRRHGRALAARVATRMAPIDGPARPARRPDQAPHEALSVE